MPEFLADASSRIPNLSGIKYTNPDLAAFQLCLAVEGGRFDILWGVDEVLLGSLALGARGAVGSTYNFAAPMYRRMVTAFERGDLDTARREQLRAVELVRILSRRGFMASAKALMGFRGIEVGPPRLPFSSLTGEQSLALHAELAAFGLLDGSE
jgi:N-acetylneuraminate lyase